MIRLRTAIAALVIASALAACGKNEEGATSADSFNNTTASIINTQNADTVEPFDLSNVTVSTSETAEPEAVSTN